MGRRLHCRPSRLYHQQAKQRRNRGRREWTGGRLPRTTQASPAVGRCDFTQNSPPCVRLPRFPRFPFATPLLLLPLCRLSPPFPTRSTTPTTTTNTFPRVAPAFARFSLDQHLLPASFSSQTSLRRSPFTSQHAQQQRDESRKPARARRRPHLHLSVPFPSKRLSFAA